MGVATVPRRSFVDPAYIDARKEFLMTISIRLAFDIAYVEIIV